jgi:putative transposase
MNLKMRRKHKRRLPSRIKESLVVPDKMNETWSIDFMSDTLENGRRFRVLNVMDDHNREALVNEAHYSIPAKRLVKSLEQLMHFRPKPKRIRTDNGPEFISKTFVEFCVKNKIELQYIQPGKPAQNAYIERLNRTFREDVLDAYLFKNIQEVNTLAFEWQVDYNKNHPHKSLNGQSPWLYANIKMSSPDGRFN